MVDELDEQGGRGEGQQRERDGQQRVDRVEHPDGHQCGHEAQDRQQPGQVRVLQLQGPTAVLGCSPLVYLFASDYDVPHYLQRTSHASVSDMSTHRRCR